MGLKALARIWKLYLGRYMGRFVGGFFFIAIASLLFAVEVYMIRFIFDDLLNPAADIARKGSFWYWSGKLGIDRLLTLDKEHLFTYIPVTLVLIFLFKGIFNYFGKYWMDSVGLSAITDLRQDLYAKMLRQGPDFFEVYPTGTLISRLLNDIERMKTAVSEKLTEIATALFQLAALIASAFLQDWRLTLISFVTVPLVVWPLARFSKRLRRASWRSQEEMAFLADRMKETLSGVKIVQMFRMEKREERNFSETNHSLLRVNLKATRIMALTTPLMEMIGALAIAGILYYGHFMILQGRATIGTFGAFMATLYAMYVPVKKLSQANNIVQQAVAAAERSVELLDWETKVVEAPNAVVLPAFSNEIRYEGVVFGYSEGQRVLDGLDMSIIRGQTVAIVGSSGAGKTTLVNLLPRLFDVSGGRVMIDGHDIREVTLKSLRSQIAMVTQETVLFNDSVAANIAYGQVGATQEQIEGAAKKALAHDFISAMPKGYDTVIGEGGFALSGGERQRLAIARALLKDPPILILDEATSALDSESEYAVQQALFNLLEGRTTLVIAHRLATILHAHHIIVLANGRIAESGTHKELLKLKGLYAQFCSLEFRLQEAT